MLELEQIIKVLNKDRNLSEVCRRTGLNYLTVWKIAHGCGGRTSYETVKKLSDYLEEKNLGE
jgi:hypothetical protein